MSQPIRFALPERRAVAAASLALLGVLASCSADEEVVEPWEELAAGRVEAAVTSVAPDPLSQDLLGDIARVFPERQSPVAGDADFTDNEDPNMMVQLDHSEVFVTFVSEGAGLNNALAYFTYPNGQPPTTPPALTQSNILFPATEGLAPGTRVSLGTFLAGTRIGLVLVAGAGSTTAPDLSKPKYYSLPGLNPDGSHFISKYHRAEQRRVVGAEDLPLASSDLDYNDALVIVRSTPPEVDYFNCDKQPFVVRNTDEDNNYRPRASFMCDCSQGEVMVAIGYKDMMDGDSMESIRPRCLSRVTGVRRWLVNEDADNNTRSFVNFNCPPGSLLRGVTYKDSPLETGTSDFADGLTPFCAPNTNPATNPNSGGFNPVNDDLNNNNRLPVTFACPAGSNPVGIVYKDTPVEWGNSDLVDSVTVICRAD